MCTESKILKTALAIALLPILLYSGCDDSDSRVFADEDSSSAGATGVDTDDIKPATPSSSSMCPDGIATGDILIRTAAGLEQVLGCKSVGRLIIMGAEIESLEAFSGITDIEQELIITGTNLSDLQGFGSVESVVGNVLIWGNAALVNLDGLSNLKSVQKLTLSGNAKLVDLHGLTSFEEAQSVVIRNNASLPNCEAKWLIELLGFTLNDSSNAVCSNHSDACGDMQCARLFQ
jgi:hypothetical protein